MTLHLKKFILIEVIEYLTDSYFSTFRNHQEWVMNHFKNSVTYKVGFESSNHTVNYVNFSKFCSGINYYISPEQSVEHAALNRYFLRHQKGCITYSLSWKGFPLKGDFIPGYDDLTITFYSHPESLLSYNEEKEIDALKDLLKSKMMRMKHLPDMGDSELLKLFNLDGSGELLKNNRIEKDLTLLRFLLDYSSVDLRHGSKRFEEFKKLLEREKEILLSGSLHVDEILSVFPQPQGSNF